MHSSSSNCLRSASAAARVGPSSSCPSPSSVFRKCRPLSLLVRDRNACITVSLFYFRASPLACSSPFLSLCIRSCFLSSSICNSRLEPLKVYIWGRDGQGDGWALRGTSGPLLLLSSAGREAFSRY